MAHVFLYHENETYANNDNELLNSCKKKSTLFSKRACSSYYIKIQLYCNCALSKGLKFEQYVYVLGNVDKFPNELSPINPKLGCSEPMQEGFLFGNTLKKSIHQKTPEIMHEVKHRDIGTEMTPLGSSTTSRCPTPFKSTSPARHTTPADRSGPLALISTEAIDITESHLAKLNFGTQFDSVTSNWSSREEEEEDVSKSLRHFEMISECRKSVSELRTSGWDDEEKTKSCHRYDLRNLITCFNFLEIIVN